MLKKAEVHKKPMTEEEKDLAFMHDIDLANARLEKKRAEVAAAQAKTKAHIDAVFGDSALSEEETQEEAYASAAAEAEESRIMRRGEKKVENLKKVVGLDGEG